MTSLGVPRLSPRRSGQAAAWLLFPQVVAGTWLWLVPDRLAFTTNQLVVFAHVAFGFISLPLAIGWALRHTRRPRLRVPRPTPTRALEWLLAAWAIAATATGIVACLLGQGMPSGSLHGIVALGVALPLAAHMALSGRPVIATLSLLLLAGVGGGTLHARESLVGVPEKPATPAFSFQTHPESLYDSAQWCGRCHSGIYDEWSRSMHSRTMQLRNVQHDFNDEHDFLDFDIARTGAVANGHDKIDPRDSDKVVRSCTRCHAPTSYFGDDRTPILTAGAPMSEGVTCSFCHTLRDVRPAGSGAPIVGDRSHGLHGLDIRKVAAATPYYVSAPETVRRYLWQDASNPVLSRLGDLLIRWRPEMHRHDYKVGFLPTAQACSGCHSTLDDVPELPVRTFNDWSVSRYNTRDPQTTVACQDCHMTTHMTGAPVREPGNLVTFGPERPQRRSHLFVGGNVVAAREFNDTELAKLQHELNQRAVSMHVVDAHLDGSTLDVKVAVRNVMTGHLFTARESALRFGWVGLEAFSANGASLGQSQKPNPMKGDIKSSPLIFRCVDDDLHMTCNTTLAPDEERTFEARLELPAGSVPSKVTASVFHSFDPDPIASAPVPLR